MAPANRPLPSLLPHTTHAPGQQCTFMVILVSAELENITYSVPHLQGEGYLWSAAAGFWCAHIYLKERNTSLGRSHTTRWFLRAITADMIQGNPCTSQESSKPSWQQLRHGSNFSMSGWTIITPHLDMSPNREQLWVCLCVFLSVWIKVTCTFGCVGCVWEPSICVWSLLSVCWLAKCYAECET